MRFVHLLIWWLLVCAPAHAGTLTQAELAKRFPAPLVVGEKAADVPAWPLFKQNGTRTELVGYAFESADLAPVPGFAGVPPNLLVVIDPKGTFLDVAVLSQHEPVFLEGLGEAPLRDFLQQYRGRSLGQGITVGGGKGSLDGVSKATASVRIINQSVLSAALKVARAKLGFAQGRDPGRIGRIRDDVFTPMSLQEMVDAGLVHHVRVRMGDVERLFAGSAGAGLDAQALAQPDDVFIDLWVAWASVPAVGRNLLAPRTWNRLQGRLEPGDHALLVLTAGPHTLSGADFVRGSVPRGIVLRQDRLPVEMRDLDLEPRLADGVHLPADEMLLMRVIGQAGLDPARALDFALPVTRSKGIVYPERITREIGFSYRLPEAYYIAPESAAPAWQASWKARRVQLAVLGVALALLAVALWQQRWLVAHARRFVDRERLVDEDGVNRYVTHANLRRHLAFPVQLLHGEANELFDVQGALNSFEALRPTHRPWQEAFCRTLRGEVGPIVVPGHGPVARDIEAAFAPERHYLQVIVDGVRKEIGEGKHEPEGAG